jgi:single-stranded DNA-binding protein
VINAVAAYLVHQLKEILMAENNIVILRGSLVEDPFLENLPSGTPFLHFRLAVERDPSQMPHDMRGKEFQAVDVMRVVRYGVQAKIDYFYLQQGAQAVVFGWNQSRLYTEHKGGKPVRRLQLEVNAQCIIYGPNCNFERGNRQRAASNEKTSQGLNKFQRELASALPGQIRELLSSKAE